MIRMGIDVGGTFTDVLLMRDSQVAKGKDETTSYDLTVGVLGAIEDAAGSLGISLSDALKEIELLRYSTTAATNALIERTGPRLGLITTTGFEDVIEIGRAHNWADGRTREEIWDSIRRKRPEPLIPRELRVGVRERVDLFGNVLMPLKREDVLEKVYYLIDKGVRGFVVCLLWSFINSAHEKLIREIIREEFPESYLGNMVVVLSSEVSPQICEYKRSITTILDAYMKVSIEEHIIDLIEKLDDHGCKAPLMLGRNIGGLASPARTRSVHLFGAGPVAGVMGSVFWSKTYGLENVIVTDMGGTSFDLGTIVGGTGGYFPSQIRDPVLDVWRIHVPIIAVSSIGAGGGSIAAIDEVGRLRVGPKSAGAMPGPACYNKGGVEPTVTDADVLLGYINPDYFLGGRLRVNREKAAQAIQRRIADPLGLTVEDAAYNIRRLIDGVMGQEIFKETAIKGLDTRDFILFALGGAGPAHCCSFAKYADLTKIIVFGMSGVFNSLGVACQDIVQTYEAGRFICLFDPWTHSYTSDYETFNKVVRELQELALRDLKEEGFSVERIVFQLELDMKYGKQYRSTRFVSPRLECHSEADVQAVCDAFNEAFGRQYTKGVTTPANGIFAEYFKLSAIVVLPRPEFPVFRFEGHSPKAAFKGKRLVFWDDAHDFVETRLYEWDALRCGNVVEGPAVIEGKDSTYVVGEGWKLTVDEHLAGKLEREV